MMEADVSLQALAALEALRLPELALSAYLPSDPGAGHGYYRTLLEDLTRAELHQVTEAEANALLREAPEVRAVLEKRRFDSPAVAVFSCLPLGFLRIWRLVEPVPARISVANRLDLAAIRRQLVEHPPALAAIVDKCHARLYALVLDELTEVGCLDGLPIRRHKQGGRSAPGLQRRQDEHARWNLSGVAETVVELLERDGFRRLILAGPTEARAELKSRLPASALRLLAAEGPLPLYAAGSELARRIRTLDHVPAPA
jgi:hypothetical protein